ncbi:TIGR02922 family protein [Thalassotalea agarivorans]|uniref:TIGR02922 family protein n=1 Tax=Thalassotalea agarivorans TaxID=349064 RepID=A0A1I0HAX9_THASX|nr:TIGR02922 family protein [Thalassotalea agarivorans]SET80930.1 TIGR02922 family protein [Thalassotalea agarivorans]
MDKISQKSVTVFFFEENALQLSSQTISGIQVNGGRVILPKSFKQGKSIIAVFEGRVKMLNVLGERAMPTKQFSIAS